MDFICDPSLVLYLPLHQMDGPSFISRDARGHQCTVTGAVWTPHGRSFDGVDDLISVPLDLSAATKLTLEAWVYLDSTQVGEGGIFLVSGLNAVGITMSTTTLYPYHGGNSVAAQAYSAYVNQWAHIVATYAGLPNQPTVKSYINGGTPASGTSSNNVTPGTFVKLGGDYWLKGKMGEARIYTRVLTPLEVQRNYLATKWRYR
ncbi:MAG: LamG domain-containing protein [Dehalococcoidales bacterium]|nr:LamG domain-containing protein [Dehalococcoidales bacterium]